MPDPAPFDHSRAAAFEERLVGVLNAGALCLMTSLGHQVGLFDVMADMPAASSEAIAARSGLNERYVREWLGAMVASGVVDYDPRDGTYAFPREHAAFLTRAATPANLAVFAQYIPLLGRVEDDVVACFRLGGGVPYARFERFHEVMAEDSGQTVLPVLKSHILPLVPGLDERLKDGIRVLDVGGGRGRALNLLATWFPNSSFVGIDLSEEAIKFARVEAEQRGNKNVRFIARDLSRFDQEAQPGTFDFITTFDPFTTKPAREISCAAFGSRWPTTESTWRRTSKPRATSSKTGSTRLVRPALHDFVHALHDGVIGARRRRPRRNVGHGDGGAVSSGSRVSLHRSA